MEVLLDWILIVLGSIMIFKAYRNIIYKSKVSVANFILIICYVFCVVPILLNYVIGKPQYITVYWYKPFMQPMNNEVISIIYDIYILISLIILYFYIKKTEKKENCVQFDNMQDITITLFNNKIISTICILSPIIYILFSGTWRAYLIYNTTTLRGFSEGNYSVIMNSLLLLSLFVFLNRVYRGKISFSKIFFSVIYFFTIIWISGKRFMIANIFIMVLFFINQMDIEKFYKKKLGIIIPIVAVCILGFSAFYLIKIKPLSNTSFNSVYEMLRVDFGRDDVIKYAISKEFMEEKMILDYRGQSFLNLALSFVPRRIWQSKPYPHYIYLTSSILNLPITKLPAGTTPSWYEMCLCNFSYIGFGIGCIGLYIMCLITDKTKNLEIKSLLLMLIIAVLTQSIDAYIIYILILIVSTIFNFIFKGKQIKIIWR